MNMNQLAQVITKSEGLKEALTIAQVKEVLRLTAVTVVANPIALQAFLANGKRQLDKAFPNWGKALKAARGKR